MLCEKCNTELKPDDTACPKCGHVVAHNISGFENTIEIRDALKNLVDTYGIDLLSDTNKFVSLLSDSIPYYDKERKLIRNVLLNGVIENMRKEENNKLAMVKAKEYMTSEMFLSENAAEFILVCFAYTFGWEYTPTLVDNKNDKQQPKEEEQKNNKNPDLRLKVLQPADNGKFKLKSNVIIPEGYTIIDSFCFDSFGFMRTVKLPSTLQIIGEYAFSECKRLKSVDFPKGLKVIKQGAFSTCAKLAMAKIPDGVLAIEDNTFSFCHSLEIVEIPNTVTSIGNEAFSGCESLKKLFIPDSVKYIESDAFTFCNGLTLSCYENSYVHKYCMSTGIKYETVTKNVPFNV